MVKVEKFSSLTLDYLVLSAVSVFAGFLFRWMFPAIDGFVRAGPWQGWLFLLWLPVMLYALLAWAFCFVAPWIYFLGPLTYAPAYVVWVRAKRRKVALLVSGRHVIFQARKLAKTFSSGRFGRAELEAFLGAVHIALSLGIRSKLVERWIAVGFYQAKNAELTDFRLSVSYRPEEPDALPRLLMGGEEVKTK